MINQDIITWTASDFLPILFASDTRWTADHSWLLFKPLISLRLCSPRRVECIVCEFTVLLVDGECLSHQREGGSTEIERVKWRRRAHSTVVASQQQFDVWDGCSFWDLSENRTIFSVKKALLWQGMSTWILCLSTQFVKHTNCGSLGCSQTRTFATPRVFLQHYKRLP